MSIPFERDYLYEEYVLKRRSPYDIAEEWNTYASKIRRALEEFGLPIRSRSAAITLAYENSRRTKKGHSQTEETKKKISEGVIKTWENKKATDAASVAFHKEVVKKAIKINGKKAFKDLRDLAAGQTRLAAVRGTLIVKYIMENLDGFLRTKPPVNLISADGKSIIVIDGFYRNNKKNAQEKFETRNNELASKELYEKIIVVKYHEKFFKVRSARILLDRIRSGLYDSKERILIFEHPSTVSGEEIGQS